MMSMLCAMPKTPPTSLSQEAMTPWSRCSCLIHTCTSSSLCSALLCSHCAIFNTAVLGLLRSVSYSVLLCSHGSVDWRLCIGLTVLLPCHPTCWPLGAGGCAQACAQSRSSVTVLCLETKRHTLQHSPMRSLVVNLTAQILPVGRYGTSGQWAVHPSQLGCLWATRMA